MLAKKPFLFVTVGSTDFDALVEAADRLLPALDVEGMVQIGNGKYVPQNLPYFRFAQSLVQYYERANLVIAHGGVGTTMEVLRRGVPLVSVSNPDRYDGHQDDLLSFMAEEGHLVWCRQLESLGQAIHTAQTTPLRTYQPPECRIHLVINEFLNGQERRPRGRNIIERGV